MNDERISSDLPFIRKKAVEALKADYPDRSTAAAAIASAINSFYRTNYPDVYAQHRAQVETAAQQVQAIYIDCDADAVLLKVEQVGGIACHTGRASCFYRKLENGKWVEMDPVLKDPSLIYKK